MHVYAAENKTRVYTVQMKGSICMCFIKKMSTVFPPPPPEGRAKILFDSKPWSFASPYGGRILYVSAVDYKISFFQSNK